jgi:hypothetical protein
MIGMRRHATNNFPQKISRHHRVGIGATNPAWRFDSNPTGTHVTDATTNTIFTEFTDIFLPLGPCKAGIDTIGIRFL